VRTKSFKLTVDSVGELFVSTATDLSGYEIQIKRGARTLKSVRVS
jgi:hypothetical protein